MVMSHWAQLELTRVFSTRLRMSIQINLEVKRDNLKTLIIKSNTSWVSWLPTSSQVEIDSSKIGR